MEFLASRIVKSGGTETHTLFTGGCILLRPEDVEEFHSVMGGAIRQGATIPSINEKRTTHFPLYLDVDLKVPVARLEADVVVRMASCVNAKVHLFFEGTPPPTVVVCARGGAAKEVAPNAYKHGLHLHWPKLVVDVDRARQIRLAMVHALDFLDWTDALGTSRVDWDDALDDGAYRTGLRMVGAPKASPCKTCAKDKPVHCGECWKINNNHVVDERAYEFCTCLTGVDVDVALTRRLAGNATYLVQQTSVRCKDASTPRTEPYAVYANCPKVVDAPSAKRRKTTGGGGAPSGGSTRTEVTHERVLRVVRRHLVQHSPNYENSRARVFFDGKSTYRVHLSGDGSNFCLNKGDHHTSEHVYMEIFQVRGRRGTSGYFASRMRCWCKKMTVRPASGKTCEEFRGDEKKLTPMEVPALFHHLGASVCCNGDPLVAREFYAYGW